MANVPTRVEERPAFGYYADNGLGWADPGAPTLVAGCAGLLQNGFANGVSWNDIKSFNGANCRKPTFNTQAGTFHTPYWEQWSIGIQQALGDKTALTLTYVGNHGVHIPINNTGLNGYDPTGIYGNTFPAAPPTGDFEFPAAVRIDGGFQLQRHHGQFHSAYDLRLLGKCGIQLESHDG